MGHPPSARRSPHAPPPAAAAPTTGASVLGCPWRIDFSRALAMLIASKRQRDFDEFFLLDHVMSF
jgi:hypothetical protein